MNKIGVILKINIKSAILIMNNFGAKNCTLLTQIIEGLADITVGDKVYRLKAGEMIVMPLSRIFVGDNPELLNFTVNTLRIFAISFTIGGFNIFGSAFFTALNNGLVSAVISFLKTLVFEIGAVFLLPIVFGINGIWCSVIVAEVMALVVAGLFFIGLKKRYNC